MQTNILHGFSVCRKHNSCGISFTHMHPEVAQAKRTTKKSNLGLLQIDLARAKSVAPVNKFKKIKSNNKLGIHKSVTSRGDPAYQPAATDFGREKSAFFYRQGKQLLL